MWVGGQRHAPASLPQGRSGWERKTSPPPGFDPRTVQPVRYPGPQAQMNLTQSNVFNMLRFVTIFVA